MGSPAVLKSRGDQAEPIFRKHSLVMSMKRAIAIVGSVVSLHDTLSVCRPAIFDWRS
ncbi:MAG: hypothetical protein WBA57_07500 [Elainellaceae cyanobacterium]